MQHGKTFFSVKYPRGRSHNFEIAQQVGFHAGKPRPRRFQVGGLDGKGQVLGFHNAVVPTGKLLFEDAAALFPDGV
ncbi:hypothetical protein SDC9_122170 [bioreactor metagenome]|uniref:Uncharacterized protein n=1 Tax=bioreactor metagenome TaxID=1076179 RepID=A0A645CDZ6_9ZZZZ